MESKQDEKISVALETALEMLPLSRTLNCPGPEKTLQDARSKNPFLFKKAQKHCEECLDCLYQVQSHVSGTQMAP